MTPCTGEVADSPSGHGGFWGPVRSEYTDLNGHGLDGHGYLYPFCFTILETRIMYLHVFIIRKKDIINVISDFTFILSGKMTLFGTNRQVLQTSTAPFVATNLGLKAVASCLTVPLPSNSNRSKTSIFWGAKKTKKPMQIFIKTYTGKRPVLEVELDSSVKDVKKQVWEKEGIPPEQQVLWFAGKLGKDMVKHLPGFLWEKTSRVYLKYKQPRNLYNIDTKNCQF